jgi:ABC-2 type transport system permease protein
LGKYLGALGLVLTLVIATAIYPLAMFWFPWDLGPLDSGAIWAGYIGLVLFSAAAVAVGLLVSSLTESQAIAFFVTFFVLLLAWFAGTAAMRVSGSLGNVLNQVCFQSRLEGFTRGLVDSRDVIYFLSVTIVSLVVAFRALERRKWS